ncbi:MAG: aminotransferase class V-fold PLP-dependent enzyme [Desulfurococcales archaeon]|nr:aminotransferase class V-fold PLP-dependent enzyme [Desulfurococcales archaeon]
MGEYKKLLETLLEEKLNGPTVLGGMIPHPDPQIIRDSIGFIDENLGDLNDFPATGKAIEYISKKLSEWMFSSKYPGMATSGGTEGNFLAAFLAKIKGASKIVAFETAHYSIWKTAEILGMKPVRLTVEKGYIPRIDLLEDALDDKSLLVLTIGTTETGFIDPVLEAASTACRLGAKVHVDGAFAGVIQKRLTPHKIPRVLDDCVRTYTVDLHKIPEAPSPSGFLFVSTPDLLENLFFEAEYIPSGRQFGLLGTRPGWTIIAGALSLARIEDKGGIESLASKLMDASKSIVEQLSEYDYSVPHNVETPIVCLLHSEINKVFRNLRKSGYNIYKCLQSKGLRLAITPWLLREYGVNGVVNLLGEAASTTL